jgi:hypothetical protein
MNRARFAPPSPITAQTEEGRAQLAAATLYGLAAMGDGKREASLFHAWRAASTIAADALNANAYNQGTPWEAARIMAGLCADLAAAFKEHNEHAH